MAGHRRTKAGRVISGYACTTLFRTAGARGDSLQARIHLKHPVCRLGRGRRVHLMAPQRRRRILLHLTPAGGAIAQIVACDQSMPWRQKSCAIGSSSKAGDRAHRLSAGIQFLPHVRPCLGTRKKLHLAVSVVREIGVERRVVL